MSQLTGYRMRFLFDPHNHSPMQCILQGRAPLSWRGVDIDIEYAIGDNGVFVNDITNIPSVVLEVFPSNNRSGPALFPAKTCLLASMNQNLTAEEWATHAADKRHGLITLSAAETQFDFTGATNNMMQFWMVFHTTLSGTNKRITLGATNWEVEEDAVQNGVPAIGARNPNFRVLADGTFQLVSKRTGKYRTPFFDGETEDEEIICHGDAQT
jgi:hypothetical protein